MPSNFARKKPCGAICHGKMDKVWRVSAIWNAGVSLHSSFGRVGRNPPSLGQGVAVGAGSARNLSVSACRWYVEISLRRSRFSQTAHERERFAFRRDWLYSYCCQEMYVGKRPFRNTSHSSRGTTPRPVPGRPGTLRRASTTRRPKVYAPA